MASDVEVLEGEKAEGLFERLVAQFVVVENALSLKTHGSQSHAEPRVELMELCPVCCKRRAEVLRKTTDNAVETFDQRKVEIVFSDGEAPDLVLELLQ